MTLDGLLTFLTLLVGALTFMTPVARLRLRLALLPWMLWSLMGLISVLYLEFFHVVGLTCLRSSGWVDAACGVLEIKLPPNAGPSDITPAQVAFLVTLTWLALTGVGLVRPTVHGWSLHTLKRLVMRLVHERRYGEALELLEPNLPILDRFASRKRRIQRLYDTLTPKPWQMSDAMKAQVLRRAAARAKKDGQACEEDTAIALTAPGGKGVGKPQWRERFAFRCGPWIARIVPSGAGREAAAGDILRMVLNRREVVEYIADQRPAFAGRLLPLSHHLSNDFSDDLLARLIERPGSALYEEVRDSQNLSGCSYYLQPDAWILRALLDDARIAQRLNAYDPVPRQVIAMLNPNNDRNYAASLNLPWDHSFAEQGVWRDPVFIAIRYLDLIVRAAACQAIEDHMWLYYVDDLAEAIEARYDDSGPEVDLDAEWPIRSSRMLYAIVDVLVDWIRIVEKLPPDSPHLVPENLLVDRGSANIPKSAAVTLGDVMKRVAISPRINERFKVYLLEVVLRRMRDWGPEMQGPWIREITVRAVAQGGTIDGGPDYRRMLCALYEQVDRPWYLELKDFEAAIGYPCN